MKAKIKYPESLDEFEIEITDEEIRMVHPFNEFDSILSHKFPPFHYIKLLQKQNDDLKKELEVTDQILANRQQVLDAIPECPVHGKCVPHALEWIQEMKKLTLKE